MLVTTKRISRPLVVALDPSAGAAVGVPGFCLVAGLSKAAQTGFLVERAASANVVGSFIDQPVEHGVAGQTEDEVDAILVAPLHDLRAAVMTVAADGHARRRPVLPYAAVQPAQVTADLDARGRLGGAQQHGDRTACRGLVDMDRQKAALIVMGVEQRELLMAVND